MNNYELLRVLNSKGTCTQSSSLALFDLFNKFLFLNEQNCLEIALKCYERKEIIFIRFAEVAIPITSR